MDRPCLRCGQLITNGSRCTACTHRRQRPKDHPHENTAKWKKLSLKVRKLQHWCMDCGTKENLTGDHIIPVSERPDLAYELLNVTVRCRSCNGRRANHCTDIERQQVLDALGARATRRGG